MILKRKKIGKCMEKSSFILIRNWINISTMISRFLVVGGLICPPVDHGGLLVFVVGRGGGGSLEHFG